MDTKFRFARPPVLALGVASALALMTGAWSTTAARPSATSVSMRAAGTCSAREKAANVRALRRFRASMLKARRAYFRAHPNSEARRAFVERQEPRLRRLRAAAACNAVAAGARVVATIPIPNNGGVGVGAGRVWLIDRADGLLEVDPATNHVVSKFSGVVGAAPVVGEGAVWVASGSLLNALLRVDLATHAVTKIATGPSNDELPITVALTPGAVWVGNHHGGTIARVDPITTSVVASVPWGEHLNGGPYHMAAEGSRVWVTASRTRDVAEIDISTNAIVRRIPVPTGTCGGVAADAAAVWVTSGYDAPYPCWFTASWGVARVDRASGNVTRIDVGGRPIDIRLAYGSVWVLVDAPQLALVRVNPQTYRVVGRLVLNADRCLILKTGSCPGAEYAKALEAGFGSLWIRRSAASSSFAGAGATGALLRVNPMR